MRIILTGATGLIGSRFEELMFENHEIIPLSSRDVDLTSWDSVMTFFDEKAKGQIDAIIHLAAKTDVDGCEVDKEEDLRLIRENVGERFEREFSNIVWKPEDWFGRSSAFSVNFIGTRNLYEEAKKRGIKFIYISTDFVFKGNDAYDEESTPDPINWYGMTKWYGERLINVENDLIVRLSFPYGYPSPVKPDFIQKLIGFLRDREEVSLIEDQTITPTFIDDIVNGLDFLLQKGANGIYHLTGSSYEDPYHIGHIIKSQFGFDTKINATTREQIYEGKAERPFQSIMRNDKLKALGFIPKDFAQGLELIKNSSV